MADVLDFPYTLEDGKKINFSCSLESRHVKQKHTECPRSLLTSPIIPRFVHWNIFRTYRGLERGAGLELVASASEK